MGNREGWMGRVKANAFSFLDSCACCPPGSRRQLATRHIPLDVAAKHAFLLAVREAGLPREALVKIFEFCTVVEQRVEVRHQLAVTARPGLGAPSGWGMGEPSDLCSQLQDLDLAGPA